MKRRGFTLIELLVVIAIIALLISILMPALSSVRRLGQTTTCLASLKSLATGGALYANDNDDAYPGGPGTSGIYLFGQTTAFGHAVQRWDFMGPIAKTWGVSLKQSDGSNQQQVAERFAEMVENKLFLCPSNSFLATHFAGPNAGTVRMVSYNASRHLMWQRQPLIPGTSIDENISWYDNEFEEKLPANYKPVSSLVGVAANKVLYADGSRFSTETDPPDYDLELNARYGGAFADIGPFSTFSRSWCRKRAPGNGATGTVDPRAYGFRHANAIPGTGAAPNAYRGNFSFWDGHAETKGDLEASNPQMWLPRGSTIEGTGGMYPDTIARFGLNGTITIGG